MRAGGLLGLDRGRARLLAAVLGTVGILAWLTAGTAGYETPFGSSAGVAVQPYGPGDRLGPVQQWDAAVDTAWVFAALLSWTVVLHLRAWRTGAPLRWEVEPGLARFRPVVVQSLVVAYWALHWPDLRGLVVPGLFVQGLFCVWLDALLSWALFGLWRANAGPLAIVLSTNLFLLYFGSSFRMNFVVFTLALMSKLLIRTREGHVFNPSGFGMAVMTVCWLAERLGPRWPWLSGTFGYLAAFDPFALAPNMTELLFLCALVLATQVPIVLVTIGGFFAFLLPVPWREVTPPSFVDPPIFIALALLITDPRTSPRSASGKLLFGFSYALIVRALDPMLEIVVHADDAGKILAVPLVNLLVPRLEAWGGALDLGVGRWLAPKYNRWHVAVWAVLGLLVLAEPGGKAARHADRAEAARWFFSPWAEARDGCFTCGPSDVWCTPFSFLDEARVVSSVPPRPYERLIPYLVAAPPHGCHDRSVGEGENDPW